MPKTPKTWHTSLECSQYLSHQRLVVFSSPGWEGNRWKKKQRWANFSTKYVNGIILFLSKEQGHPQTNRLWGIFSTYIGLYMLAWGIISDSLGHHNNRKSKAACLWESRQAQAHQQSGYLKGLWVTCQAASEKTFLSTLVPEVKSIIFCTKAAYSGNVVLKFSQPYTYCKIQSMV